MPLPTLLQGYGRSVQCNPEKRNIRTIAGCCRIGIIVDEYQIARVDVSIEAAFQKGEKMHSRISLLVLALLVPSTVPAWSADKPSAQFNVSEPTLIPGATLQPGTYSIQVVDHLQDRFVLGVDGKGGTSHTLFIAVPSKSLKKTGSSGAIPWNTAASGKAALRGFDFGKSSAALEFVYPKDDAVSLAKANGTPVLAVDPASEGKSPQLSQLSNDDMQMVTLWTLTPERVGAAAGAEPTISASKYQGDAASGPTQQEAQLHKPPVLKTLPHTASTLPLILILGLLSALAAVLLRRSRASRATV
jgi:hypothetical protein